MKDIVEIDKAIQKLSTKPLTPSSFIQLTHFISDRALLIRNEQERYLFFEDLIELGLDKNDAKKFNSLRNEVSHGQKSNLKHNDLWIRTEIIPLILRSHKTEYDRYIQFEELVLLKLTEFSRESGYKLTRNERIRTNYGQIEIDAILKVGRKRIPIEVKHSVIYYVINEALMKLRGIMKSIHSSYGILIIKDNPDWTLEKISKENRKKVLIATVGQIQKVLSEWIHLVERQIRRIDWIGADFDFTLSMLLKYIDLLLNILDGEKVSIARELREFSEKEMNTTLSDAQVRGLLRKGGVFSKLDFDPRIKIWKEMPMRDAISKLVSLRGQLSKLKEMP